MLERPLPLSEYFIERLSGAIGTGSLEKKAVLATKAMGLLRSMPESSIKKLLELEVSKVTGLSAKDIEESSKSKSVGLKRKKKESSIIQNRNQQEVLFEPHGLTTQALAALITFPSLRSEIKSVEWIKELSSPESRLFLVVLNYFQTSPNGQVADLLSILDDESASLIGSLLASSPILEKKNSVAHFRDCLDAMKRENPAKRIIELKMVLKKEKLSEDETFELQQHLLTNLESLNDEDKKLLRNLSKRL